MCLMLFAALSSCSYSSQLSIDSFSVIAEWRNGIKAEEPSYTQQEWLNSHVRASQYFLQIVKCNDEECCEA